MIYLEMSRIESHGGGDWSYPLCIWAPAKKASGDRWPFWSKILDVRKGDTVLHLRGIPPRASFTGYSTVASPGFETSSRPPDPGEWSFSQKYVRADLESFVPFDTPLNLGDIFRRRATELIAYLEGRKTGKSSRRNLFFVRQSGRLQCLNGAYLSNVDTELFEILFDREAPKSSGSSGLSIVYTSTAMANLRVRVGQSQFADEVKRNYRDRCCFPNCAICDSRFLVGSHIARWADDESLRGHVGNGLCLCVTHDRAFELGLFTLDQQLRVVLNPKEPLAAEPMKSLEAAAGARILLSENPPNQKALQAHWERIGFDPRTQR